MSHSQETRNGQLQRNQRGLVTRASRASVRRGWLLLCIISHVLCVYHQDGGPTSLPLSPFCLVHPQTSDCCIHSTGSSDHRIPQLQRSPHSTEGIICELGRRMLKGGERCWHIVREKTVALLALYSTLCFTSHHPCRHARTQTSRSSLQ
ncbi:hypothetical protein WMY93_023983 [Mugilogobius chulae]|uniref:Uncharacterized protein n=1 Tax=Mugilogobius chulae TaxID=88201 RepID=A0AAW0NGV7_9GOBI